jgi:hypothetical protein
MDLQPSQALDGTHYLQKHIERLLEPLELAAATARR